MMKYHSQPILLLIIFTLLGGSLLSACDQVAKNIGRGEGIANETAYPAPEVIEPAATYTPFPYPEPGAEELAVVMKASDPTTVQLTAGQPQLIEFFAFWCYTCRNMAPIVYELAAEYSGRINFVYLDIDDPANDQFKQALGYKYQPHFILLDAQGNKIKEWLGTVPRDDLVAAFEESLSK